ncbi:mdis1-interacting receptor like kinase 2 [Quercus suber]|uniref:non-specific serine/threonine protein kinase n=1 Tax=Quercus suber TaxID=58331 RepID=A0AAW0MB80_QUESU
MALVGIATHHSLSSTAFASSSSAADDSDAATKPAARTHATTRTEMETLGAMLNKVVALEKFHCLEAKDPTFDKSFKNEVKMNIVKLHGYCLDKRCMFLIYEYKKRGSLFCVLNNGVEAMELDWIKRVNIIKGIAHVIYYMHHDSMPL